MQKLIQKIFLNKIVLIVFSLLVGMQIVQANSESQITKELQQHLLSISAYSADFKQTARDNKGKIVSQSEGQFMVKRPNLFRLETLEPQQNLIIADGKTLWFYDPFVEQVTANWVEDAINDSPFILLTSNDKVYWDQYEVSKIDNQYRLIPKSNKASIKYFDISFNRQGLLRSFGTTDVNNQSNIYILTNISDSQSLNNSLFQFAVGKGEFNNVELDDQRKKKN